MTKENPRFSRDIANSIMYGASHSFIRRVKFVHRWTCVCESYEYMCRVWGSVMRQPGRCGRPRPGSLLGNRLFSRRHWAG